MVNPNHPISQSAPGPLVARERLYRVLDRAALVIISLSTLYWIWVRVGTSDALRGLRALSIPWTVILLLAGCLLFMRFSGKLRDAGKIMVLSGAMFWLAAFYTTGGQTVYFRLGKLPFASVHKAVLCTSACFAMIYLLAAVLRIIQRYPRQMNRICFCLGSVVVIFVSIDLWFCISPPVEPAVVGEYVYRRQYHPVFTYAVPNTYVTRDARERTVRDYGGASFAQTKPPEVVRIVLSGASTVWGHGLTEHQTLRSQLESRLKKRIPEHRWEVVCVAYQGKFQLNELVDTVAVLPQWSPDLVISLNGYNEISYGETPGRYFGQPFIDEQVRLRFGESVLARLTHVGPVVSALHNQPGVLIETEIDPKIPPLYYTQLRLSARTLKGLRIPYAYSFCPNVFELSDPNEDESGQQRSLDGIAAGDERPKSRVVRERRTTCAQIVQEEGQISFDVMALLTATSGNRFLDECHLTAVATEVLASGLVDRIPEWLRSEQPK